MGLEDLDVKAHPLHDVQRSLGDSLGPQTFCWGVYVPEEKFPWEPYVANEIFAGRGYRVVLN